MRRIAIIAALGVVLVGIVALVIWNGGRGQGVKLPDGTFLILKEVKIGETNRFFRGNLLEKSLWSFIRTNGPSGISFMRLKLNRPEVQEFERSGIKLLSLEFELKGSEGVLRKSELFTRSVGRTFRILHAGKDGYWYTEEFPYYHFQRGSHGCFGYLTITAFSRTSDELTLKFQQRDKPEDSNWRDLAVFKVTNPEVAVSQRWQVEPTPIDREFGSLRLKIGRIQIEPPRDDAWPYHDIWQNRVITPVQVLWNGEITTNYGLHQVEVTDSTGNFAHLNGDGIMTNGWVMAASHRCADPFKAWKVSGHLAQIAGFGGSNLFEVEIPMPLNGQMLTNLHGVRTTIEFVNGNMLSMQIPRTRTDVRIILVDVRNEQGESIKEWSGSWGQHGFWRSLKTDQSKSQIVAKVALVRDYAFGFVTQPALVEQAKMKSEELR